MARRGTLFLLAAIALLGQERPTFLRITPVRPIAELRAVALAAQPPREQGDFRHSELVDIARLDDRIKLDIRYTTAENFLGTPVYTSARAFLQRPAADALLRAHRDLLKQGYGLLVFDGYRPWYVTKIFWDATPRDKHEFVANPSNGSRHNRGCAADLTLYDLKTGREVEMPGIYDEMSKRSYPNYGGGTSEQRHRRDLLRGAMEKQGFKVNQAEWWHFDYRDWRHYAIQNVPFEEVLLGHKVHRSNRDIDSQSATPALMPAYRGRAKKRSRRVSTRQASAQRAPPAPRACQQFMTQ